ncbi:follicular dendritic cell secreted peptide [Gracilinanus agilis]|uniref:follicular dendritic cell secreted peptide n=1 Tax=Gracilinanus agilis TaxID=191870 RepID=UPI001CFD9042|nr:follicular dendritic cell secreted peptide [Gracilinanus agilis]
MKALLMVAFLALTLGSLAAQDRSRSRGRRSQDSRSNELLPRFYGDRYQYPFGPYWPFAYPRYPWPRYYFIPNPFPAAAAPSNKK